MKAVHDMKCLPDFFAAVLDGSKPFEVRLNDRNFQVGDKLLLREWRSDGRGYTGCECHREITFVLHFPPGLKQGYVGLGLAKMSKCDRCSNDLHANATTTFCGWCERVAGVPSRRPETRTAQLLAALRKTRDVLDEANQSGAVKATTLRVSYSQTLLAFINDVLSADPRAGGGYRG